MSVTETHGPVVVADQQGRTNGSGEYVDDAPVPWHPIAVEPLIADVLGRAHRRAEALDAPHEARAILHVTLAFADERSRRVP